LYNIDFTGIPEELIAICNKLINTQNKDLKQNSDKKSRQFNIHNNRFDKNKLELDIKNSFPKINNSNLNFDKGILSNDG